MPRVTRGPVWGFCLNGPSRGFAHSRFYEEVQRWASRLGSLSNIWSHKGPLHMPRTVKPNQQHICIWRTFTCFLYSKVELECRLLQTLVGGRKSLLLGVPVIPNGTSCVSVCAHSRSKGEGQGRAPSLGTCLSYASLPLVDALQEPHRFIKSTQQCK